jgi:hypothetical protein
MLQLPANSKFCIHSKIDDDVLSLEIEFNEYREQYMNMIRCSDHISNWSNTGKCTTKDIAMLAINSITSFYIGDAKDDNADSNYYTIVYKNHRVFSCYIAKYDNKDDLKTDILNIASGLDILLTDIEARPLIADTESINKLLGSKNVAYFSTFVLSNAIRNRKKCDNAISLSMIN